MFRSTKIRVKLNLLFFDSDFFFSLTFSYLAFTKKEGFRLKRKITFFFCFLFSLVHIFLNTVLLLRCSFSPALYFDYFSIPPQHIFFLRVFFVPLQEER